MARLIIPKPHQFVLTLCADAGVKLKKFRSVGAFEREVISFMRGNDILYLATARSNSLRCTPLGYVNRGLVVYILSEGGGKFANLSGSDKVAYSIASRVNGGRGLMRVKGLQVWGRAKVISMREDRGRFESALKIMGLMRSLGKRGIEKLPPFHYRIIIISPEKISYLNLSKGINNVTWSKR